MNTPTTGRDLWCRLGFVVLATVLTAATACDDGDDDAATEAEQLTAFCEEMASIEGERPASYVGSTQHLEDINGLLDAATPEIRPAIEAYRDFLASGAIRIDDPDSNLVENWPAEIQNVIAEIMSYESSNC